MKNHLCENHNASVLVVVVAEVNNNNYNKTPNMTHIPSNIN